MMTVYGELIGMEGESFPSLEAVALGLSRMPRFGGQTLFKWTVADHLICCVRYWRALVMAGMPRPDVSPQFEAHVLMHDFHEALTGDIPTTFKTLDMKTLQERLDNRMRFQYCWPHPFGIERDYIKQIDRAMLLAEAKVCTPHATYDRIRAELCDIAMPTAVRVIEEYLHEDNNSREALYELAYELLEYAGIRDWRPETEVLV